MICKTDLSKLFSIATSQTHFPLDGKVYDQIDGVAMGSPLALVLANLLLGHHENIWLINIKVLLFSFFDAMLVILFVFSTLSIVPYLSLLFSMHNTSSSNLPWKRKLRRYWHFLMFVSISKILIVSYCLYIVKRLLLGCSLMFSASLPILIRLVLFVN